MIDSATVRTVGKYELVQLLGSGGMAEVWRATVRGAAGFRKEVALKMIRREWAEDSQFVNMFVDEACLSAQLGHPNLVATLDFGRAAGRYYLALEMIEGATLRTCLHHLERRGHRLDRALALYVIAEVAAGLDYAHHATDPGGAALHLVHRDVNPANVLLSLHGEVKLSDFGIAKAAGRAAQTEAGSLKGKIPYMSPEQAWGRALDGRSDIYALGLMLQELLTGKRALDASNEIELLERARAGDVSPPGPEVPPAVQAILRRALARDPEERYPTAGALRQEVLAVLARAGRAPMSPHRRTLEFGAAQPEDAGEAAPAVSDPDLGMAPSKPMDAGGVMSILTDLAAALGALVSEVEHGRTTSGMMSVASMAATPGTLVTEVGTQVDPADGTTPQTRVPGARHQAPTAPPQPPMVAMTPIAPMAPMTPMTPWAGDVVDRGTTTVNPAPARDGDWTRRVAIGAAAALLVVLGSAVLQTRRASTDIEEAPPSIAAPLTHEAGKERRDPSQTGTGTAKTPPAVSVPSSTPPVQPIARGTPPGAAARQRPGTPIRPSASPGNEAETAVPSSGEHGTLRIQVEPWGQVWLDGRPLGLTPLKPIEAPPGAHIIVAKNPQHGERTTRVVLAPGEGRLVELDLTRAP